MCRVWLLEEIPGDHPVEFLRRENRCRVSELPSNHRRTGQPEDRATSTTAASTLQPQSLRTQRLPVLGPPGRNRKVSAYHSRKNPDRDDALRGRPSERPGIGTGLQARSLRV